jgi:hypothetical protein
MEVRMEHTEGLGRLAQVWVDGTPLEVCDGVSPAGRRMPPGVIDAVEFAYMTAEGFSWEQAARGNRSRKKQLQHLRRWSYLGYGRVVSVMPVVVDFGLLTMEDANWSSDEDLVGRFVAIPIDRLEIRPAGSGDGPQQPADG